MKPIFAKVFDGLQEEVFLLREVDRPVFSTEFHFHVECQMTLVLESSGYKIIGDCIENFEAGELTFLGSDIPHVWHNDLKSAALLPDQQHARSIILFLNPHKLVECLSGFYITAALEDFLKISKRGLKFFGKSRIELTNILIRMKEEEGLKKTISLLQLMDLVCNTAEYSLLASAGYINTYNGKENGRIDKIFKFLFSNFSREISLDEIASEANMNKQAFCRFFKARTQKTLIEFINEIRIGHAIKLMSTEDQSISAIAYQCGYNSLSHFNKYFKTITGKTPSEYRRKMQISK